MKLLLWALSLTLAIVSDAQEQQRSRVRGSRKFSLATPGLQLQSRNPPEPENQNIPSEDAQPIAQTRTRSRGTHLLRRGRPTSRTSNDLIAESKTPSVRRDDINSFQPKPQSGRIRLRRPTKKLKTTTTTTTTTELPLKVLNTQDTTIPILTDDELTLIIDEGLDVEALQNNENIGLDANQNLEENKPEIKKFPLDIIGPKNPPELKNRPKLRPIPIKTRNRNSFLAPAENNFPLDIPEVTEISPTPPSESPQNHRFSSRGNRLNLRSRLRGNTGSRNNQEVPIDVKNHRRANNQSENRSRTRVGGQPPTRLSTRGRLSRRRQQQQQEPAFEELPQEESQHTEADTEVSSRFGQRPIRIQPL